MSKAESLRRALLAPLIFALVSRTTTCFSTIGSSSDGFLVVRSSSSSFSRRETPLFAYRSLPRGDKSRRVSLRDFTASDEFQKANAADRTTDRPPTKKKKNGRRTRKRTTSPQQTYAYARSHDDDDGNDDNSNSVRSENKREAERLGWDVRRQKPDPACGAEPAIVAEIAFSDGDRAGDGGTDFAAYVIDKPAGWCVVSSRKSSTKGEVVSTTKNERDEPRRRDTATNDNDRRRPWTNPKDDLSAALAPDELAELTEEERAELLESIETARREDDDDDGVEAAAVVVDGPPDEDVAPTRLSSDDDNGSVGTATTTTTTTTTRPSVISWLKEVRAARGRPMRGGKYWKALAGAVDVEDSGLVLVCPRKRANDLRVTESRHVVVVGTGERTSTTRTVPSNDDDDVSVEVLSASRKGRADDPVSVASVSFARASVCDDVVGIVRKRLRSGVRGDPHADPLDARAPRRLIHCASLTVDDVVDGERYETSLLSNDDHDDDDDENDDDLLLPDDVAVHRAAQGKSFDRQGAFFGRSGLRANGATTAYREINGAADGHPGWIVDRYDRWLFVRHDRRYPRGPLPSIHAGHTAGVYYRATDDGNGNGNGNNNEPVRLLEGTSAPDDLVVTENGVKYVVDLNNGARASTGIFLDQRPGRAWLARHCGEGTSVLNCFAHAGAYSVAAATAGAETVSLDLDKKWLDRVAPQMEANGVVVVDSERHDRIYGDCFDWLRRLAKRDRRFDVVVLDPPSTSIGTKKRRWSVRNDMAELVALATPLVKEGGALWTTNNCATLPARRFANACKKGLVAAGAGDSRLERVVPMPEDFPSVGSQPVTNLVWRVRW